MPVYVESHAAPYVYFDTAPAHGIMNGAIQIEVFARTMHPVPSAGAVDIKFVTTGHLRCSPAAARFLCDALEAALKMLEPSQQGPTAGSKLN
jgi:hypothetical protein